MESRALLLLLALFLLIFPFIASTPQVQPAAPEPTGEVVSPTDESAATATSVAPTPEPTVEATAETTPEASGAARFPSQLLMGDATHGQDIFEHGLNGAPACINCHSVNAAGKVGFAIGPGLRGIPEIATTRIADFSAALYLEDSIRYPNDFITPGFRGIMYADFAKNYTDQEIADLVAYLMTLHDIPPAPDPAA